MPGSAEDAALARVPDLAKWVDTRGMLLSGFARVRFSEPANHDRDGFVVILPPRALVSAVGRPPAPLVLDAAESLSRADVLCPIDDVSHTARALQTWQVSCAILHELPGTMPWEHTTDPDTRIFMLNDAPALAHLPDDLQREIAEALRGMPLARFGDRIQPAGPLDRPPRPLPVAAAWADGVPVSFCYPVVQSERFWDVSIDTLEEYRGRGLAARAVRAMIRHMRRTGKSPVWGALDTNAASLAVGRKLGFVEVGRLGVFTSR
ncbi:MAG TPA: GNAT family N-acetyltransferase [Vicinamibacterales bacterium]|jgi:RimJ/RimL family protein N-acetyltransferase|nr:GNAT family N-acetyltransferase [Vicinamibacterales bacterium]